MFGWLLATTKHSAIRLCLFALFIQLLFTTLPLVVGAHETEESGYSVANLLPSFKTLLFWRVDRTSDTEQLVEAEAEKVTYQVSDSGGDGLDSESKAPDPSRERFRKKLQLSPFRDNRICHSCAKEEFSGDSDDEEYRLRIEYIKGQILTRLGMKEPPQVQSRPPIDYSMYMRIAENSINLQNHIHLADTQSDEPIDKDVDKVFVLPLKPDPKSPAFDLSNVENNGDKLIKSIMILVKYSLTEYYYRTLSDDTDLVVASAPGDGNIHNGFSLLSTVAAKKKSHETANLDETHWFQYDVTSILSDYTGKIRIYNENFDILSSVVIIEMTNNKYVRTKRSIDCVDNQSFCCRQHFYVNFTTIGWNNWIFQPPGYNANYCEGKCDISHARYHHTTVIGKYPVIKLCCSPREMSAISLIYMDEKFHIYHRNLPNMVVESCDCA